MKLTDRIKSARKLAVYVVTVAGILVDLGVLHGQAAQIAAAAIALAGTYGIYATRNDLTPAQLLQQPNFVPAVSHVPMPLYVPPTLTVSPKRDKNGRFAK